MANGHEPITEDEIKATFSYIDTNSNGMVDFDEFEFFFYVRGGEAAGADAGKHSAAAKGPKTDNVVAPNAWARVTAADMPRALNELVGFRASSLTNRCFRPSSAPRRLAGKSGVQPSPKVIGLAPSSSGSAGAYRHIERVPPGSESRDHVAPMRSQSYTASSGRPQTHR